MTERGLKVARSVDSNGRLENGVRHHGSVRQTASPPLPTADAIYLYSISNQSNTLKNDHEFGILYNKTPKDIEDDLYTSRRQSAVNAGEKRHSGLSLASYPQRGIPTRSQARGSRVPSESIDRRMQDTDQQDASAPNALTHDQRIIRPQCSGRSTLDRRDRGANPDRGKKTHVDRVFRCLVVSYGGGNHRLPLVSRTWSLVPEGLFPEQIDMDNIDFAILDTIIATYFAITQGHAKWYRYLESGADWRTTFRWLRIWRIVF
ncbi:hypothetical protein CLAFUW4_07416 [Fulvia fulva]|uniref:Uncharacterized protein n=1 Tax=Passalora fulva TaxID=5499 RepID=A0A9Q8UQV2_PASFU|nr:uncharacterized protein CLAFUR5_07546 [Fulvia fulva]KAK4621646.1 hypothetical protein CLAFUR4_07423 [Fulvia fulva]KAK4622747.1 hypothetical protein CLAFUR0_07422 [Fulvia fulva]UJO19045.1 hypothetical protein CLAFUR5_07546 [Fulvia fulva]WPV15993.1 hypothetical protein CLAFUW4_07416 [Fulvia fulva]WPV31737.1 hypothetical protein CLAFUW7_07419 [Fulvia fulva]